MLTEAASFRSCSRTGRTVPLWEGMVRGSQPLSLGMIGADISRLTMGALDAGKVEVGGEQRTRATERFEDLVYGEISCFWELSCLRGIWCCYVSRVGKTYSILYQRNSDPPYRIPSRFFYASKSTMSHPPIPCDAKQGTSIKHGLDTA